MLGVLGIAVSLILLIYLAYRGVNVILLAPIVALVAAAFSTDIPLMAGYTELFMKAMADYAKAYFPLFLLGAIFGKLMDDGGGARSISHFMTAKLGSEKAILAVVLSCAILTYGGVSLFVVAFAVYPIAVSLFRENDIPKRLVPGSIALGAFTFTMTALPGTPQIQNAIPMPYFGTTAFAAPILGIVGGVLIFGLGMLWLSYRAGTARRKGEGFGEHDEEAGPASTEIELPSIGLALTPIILVIVLNFVLSKYVFPSLDTSYLADYGTTLSRVNGLWSIIVALTVSIIVGFVLFRRNIVSVIKTLNDGTLGSLPAIFNTAAVVGYGFIVKSLSAFELIKTAILAIPGPPFVSLAVSAGFLAGITGSSSGGMSIALEALGDIYLKQAAETGINPEAFHRIVAIACGGLDSLPHSGAVITLLAICGLNHKQSYADIGMVTVVVPLLAVVVVIAMASIGIV